jgi:hypothetical protein
MLAPPIQFLLMNDENLFLNFFCIACCLCCESCKLQSLPLYLSSTTPLQLQGGSWLSETRFVSQRLDGSRGFRSSVLCALLDQGVCGSRAPCLSFYCAWAFFNSGVPPWPCMQLRAPYFWPFLVALARKKLTRLGWAKGSAAPRRAFRLQAFNISSRIALTQQVLLHLFPCRLCLDSFSKNLHSTHQR